MTLLICLVALLASALTFFSGFGLGTLLMPAFAVFYPLEVAVAATAVVHFLNGVFKLVLVGRHAHWSTVLRFGVPAMVAAVAGAWLLGALAEGGPLLTYHIGARTVDVMPAKAVVGTLLILLTGLEFLPAFQRAAFPARWLPVGGVASGFLGGVSGMQGALRAAFLVRLGLSKEAFVGTGAMVAAMVDVSRLGVYSRQFLTHRESIDLSLLAAAVASAFLGAWLGNRYLRKVTMAIVQRIVAVALVLVGFGLIAGLL